MKITFVFDVDFCKIPLLPPTIGNCEKCTFYNKKEGGCMRTNCSICQYGREGYFIRNWLREAEE